MSAGYIIFGNLAKQKEGFGEAFGRVKTEINYKKLKKKKKKVVALRGITSPFGQKIVKVKKAKRKKRRKKK